MPVTGIDGVDSSWEYHDSHLTNLTDKNFLSSARCIIYARPSRVADSGSDAVFSKIGVIQGYSWSEQKQLEMIFELGSDIPYLIPGRTTGQISVSRVLIAGADLTNIFYSAAEDVRDGAMQMRGWKRSLRDVTIPMDLLITYYDQQARQFIRDCSAHAGFSQEAKAFLRDKLLSQKTLALCINMLQTTQLLQEQVPQTQ
jgi:hypothetical protein